MKCLLSLISLIVLCAAASCRLHVKEEPTPGSKVVQGPMKGIELLERILSSSNLDAGDRAYLKRRKCVVVTWSDLSGKEEAIRVNLNETHIADTYSNSGREAESWTGICKSYITLALISPEKYIVEINGSTYELVQGGLERKSIKLVD